MSLTIDKATVGFDRTNVTKALQNLHTECIEDTITTMDNELATLDDAVDAGWVGQSAETFKNNMRADVKMISENLRAAYNLLESQMHQIVNNMEEVDQNLVQKRNGGAE